MQGVHESEQHRSVSQLTTYAQCSMRYYLARVAGHRELPAGWTIQGLAVHSAVESWEKSWRKMPLDEVIEVFESSWEAEESAARQREPDLSLWLRGGRTTTERDLESRRETGIEQVRRYMEYVQDGPLEVVPLPRSGDPAVEVPFTVRIGGVAVKGVIDQIVRDKRTGALMIRDIKTGAEPVWPLQLAVYRLAIREMYGADVRWGDFYLCKKGESTPPVDLDTIAPGFIGYLFKNLDRGIREGVFLPNPGSCFTCGVKMGCPVYNNVTQNTLL